MASKPSIPIVRHWRHGQTDSAGTPESGNIARLKTTCSTCNMRELCQPCCGLNQSERTIVNRLAFSRVPRRRGEILYRAGDPFSALYAVRDGFFKSVVPLEDGRRDQVTGFAMTGEMLGMDGIGSARQTCNAIAVEDSEVCAIPFVALQLLAHEISSLQRHFRKMMSREIAREQGVMLLLGNMNADERLAIFLLDLSRRFAAQGFPSMEFDLRMTRDEIGSYLGVELETVSRTLSKFQKIGLLRVRRKFIQILDNAGLQGVMGH